MKKILLLIISLQLFNSCTNDFAEINTNPIDQVTATPEELLPLAIKAGYSASYEYYYDYYRRIMPWTQTLVPSTGNSGQFMNDGSNMNQRKDTFYGDHGALLTDIIYKINKMPTDQQTKYVYLKSIATILKVYYAWYVTDVNGSLAYTEAFQARYGGTQTPKYETQEQLYDIFDKQLSETYTAIEGANQSIQVNVGSKDFFFDGDITKWKKVANSLRLKIASRLMKRNSTKLTAIATEVLSRDQISKQEEDFSLRSRRFTEHGNFNPIGMLASKPMVDFMNTTEDPRRRIFFEKNDYSQENINKLVAAGLMKQVDTAERYVGGPISPDLVPANKSRYYTSAKRVLNQVNYDTVSRLQYRIWRPENVVGITIGTGNAIFPLLTYADYSLLKAELVVRNLIPGNAESLYMEGIKASIKMYDNIAKEAIIDKYIPIKGTDTNIYLNSSKIKFNSSKALEQIILQEYLNYFKQPSEVWALIKRTGMPNTSTALKLEEPTRDGFPLTMPRRIALPTPSKDNLNYQNQQTALDQMNQDPGFGGNPNNIWGRIWWDKE
ncbi:SusD/RagB family nutrient-binding outer membrane lipoprotein [Chryseobacterium lactis]|uniref:SusD/RagB family nutrient-binding outer membrane lipoprotein n=1 Tax=Chryseobacterium lactis TaxID=1241981 RepID=A0A3G6RV10_CHRLC|nr:SusD/RagB family nutrient-binding outer membrane lipoprotein [Chryseobacterium lactis]AZA82041.1 SusD/RagB family nutrient-binding outer membrane lipoprotein [Chryseobacterium lactis]AZB07039.1 SusD/RagB family nutrient-binding outer membrane lipoprotein [Chryseobacterium lactis]PNW14283.1 SusD/RagB family nutrient-binding outer membrane lipoprotein [Chryseobacterium lactis]